VKGLAGKVLDGERRAIARAITLIESDRPQDRRAAGELLDRLAPNAGNSIRIGISGIPGVGKSTFIEALGNHVIDQGHRVAVLAVDPSSAISGGSIMGDKTRMERLSRKAEAFIRPSPAGGTLGGVARHTRDTILIVEAAGYDVILVETVGVGQSETTVAGMTDMFILLLLPGAGDELQGIKRGIVELADLILINKADGGNIAAAEQAAVDYRSALRLLHPRLADWEVTVDTCSSLHNEGIDRTWDLIKRYRETLASSGELEGTRARQARSWLWSEAAGCLLDELKSDPAVRQHLHELEKSVTEGKTSPRVAAQKLVGYFRGAGK